VPYEQPRLLMAFLGRVDGGCSCFVEGWNTAARGKHLLEAIVESVMDCEKKGLGVRRDLALWPGIRISPRSRRQIEKAKGHAGEQNT